MAKAQTLRQWRKKKDRLKREVELYDLTKPFMTDPQSFAVWMKDRRQKVRKFKRHLKKKPKPAPGPRVKSDGNNP